MYYRDSNGDIIRPSQAPQKTPSQVRENYQQNYILYLEPFILVIAFIILVILLRLL
jgi:hypothetical protein